MTLPEEAENSINQARKFLYELMDSHSIKRIPTVIRQRARSILKHYPFECETMTMTTTEEKIRELANVWRYSQMEASEICRDAAEELRVMRLELNAANRELELYRAINAPKFYPNIDPPVPYIPIQNTTSECDRLNGWGKGKDE